MSFGKVFGFSSASTALQTPPSSPSPSTKDAKGPVESETEIVTRPEAPEPAAAARRQSTQAAVPDAKALRVGCWGEPDFVASLKTAAFEPVSGSEAVAGTTYDAVLVDHSAPSIDTAKVLADLSERRIEAPVLLLFDPPHEALVLRTFAHDVHELVLKSPGWLTRLALRIAVAARRLQDQRELTAIRVKEARLRSLVDAIPAPIIRLTGEGTILAANPRVLSMLGAAEPKQLLRKQFHSFVVPTDRDNSVTFMRRVAGGDPRSIELALTTLGAESRYVELTATPIAAPVGGAASVVAVLRDITDRKRREASAEKVIDGQSTTPSTRVDQESSGGEVALTIPVEVSAPAEPQAFIAPGPLAWLGIPGEPTVDPGSTLDTTSPEVMAPVAPMTATAVEAFVPAAPASSTGAAVELVGLRELDDDLERLSTRARTVFEQLQASLTDAECRHQALATLQREEQARLQAAQAEAWRSYDEFVRGAVQPIVHAAPAGTLQAVNPAFVDALGFESDHALVDQSGTEDALVPHTEWVRAIDQWQDGGFGPAVELPWKRVDGRPVVLRMRGRAINGPDGESPRVEVIAENVTAQRHLQRELASARRWEEVARVTSSMAADLKAAIDTLTATTDAILAADPQQGEGIRVLRRDATKASALSAQLIAFGRRGARLPETLPVRQALENLDGVVRRLAGEHVTFDVRVEEATSRVRVDRAVLFDAMVNLAMLGVDSLPVGGALVLQVTDVELGDERPAPLESGRHVRLALSATGWGLADDGRWRLGERFRAAATAVEASGGAVRCEGTSGESLVFEVYLPGVAAAETVEN